MRRATALCIALTFCGGLAALNVGEPVRVEPTTLRVEALDVRYETPATVATTTTALTTTTTAPEPTTTTTTEPAPEPEPEPTTVPEPILCPGLRHPAHHQPCPPTPTTSARTAATRPPAPAAPAGGLLDCLAHYESTNGAGSSNIYQYDTGTWAAAFDAAVAQGLIPATTPFTSAGAAPRWVQDAATQAWINAGHLRQAWLAQAGRCF